MIEKVGEYQVTIQLITNDAGAAYVASIPGERDGVVAHTGYGLSPARAVESLALSWPTPKPSPESEVERG